MPSFKMKPPSFKLPSFKLPFFKRSKKSEDKPISSQPQSSGTGAQPFIPPIAKFDDPGKPSVPTVAAPVKKDKPKGFKLPSVNLAFINKKISALKSTPSPPSSLPTGGTSLSKPAPAQPTNKVSPIKSFKSVAKPAPAGLGIALKVIGLVLVVVVMVVVGSSAMTSQKRLQVKESQITKLEQELQSWQRQISQVQTEKEELSRRIDQISRDLKERDTRISSLQTQLMDSINDIEDARTLTSEVEEAYVEILKEQDRLIEEVRVISGEREEAREQLAAIEKVKESETGELTRTVSRLRERLSLLDRDYRELADKVARLQVGSSSRVAVIASSSGPVTIPGLQTPSLTPGLFLPANTVELPPIIVRKNRSGMAISVSGRLVEVNEPHDFVILDKGSMDGVHMGMTFDIVRGTSQIGRARVVRVRPKLAACDIIQSETKGTLQVGDRAFQRDMK